MRALILFAVLVATPAAAQARLTEADVRAFVAAQEAAWNAADFDRYFSGFTADATFTDQAYVGAKPPVLYGVSRLAEARAQARRAKARTRERGEIRQIALAADGRSAQVRARVGSLVMQDGRSRRLCASRTLTLILDGGRIRSRGQTDTYVRCRGG